ncbi:MAG: glycosyltransferase family 39 protein [Planctomycetes bacterium]|nr:glycosyltransferase family 39 protein [Planctomycetota bacterium]
MDPFDRTIQGADTVFPPFERPRLIDWLLILIPLLPLFHNLGAGQLRGSEARWLSIAQSMRETGRWFEPLLNGEPYWDKPLLSYWVIVLASWPSEGVNELAARLPSALSGAVTVLLTGWMAARLFGRQFFVAAGWILATSFSFLFWARSASADLLNLAFLTAALAVYVESYRGIRRWHLLLFFVLLGLGGHAKGLPAVFLPLGIAGLDLILCRRAELKRSAVWMAAGAVLGGLVYGLPFFLSYLSNGDWQLLRLMWKENFVRYFDAFDHKSENCLYYSYILPLMFMPWSLWLPGALGWGARRLKSHAGARFAFLCFAGIFLFFSVGQSRRSYYILPAFPFAALLAAFFWGEIGGRLERGEPVQRAWRAMLKLPVGLIAILLPLAIGYLLAGRFIPGIAGEVVRILPYSWLLALAGAGAGVFFYRAIGGGGAWRQRFLAVGLLSVLAAAYFSTGGVVLQEMGLTEKDFAREVQSAYPGKKVIYFSLGKSRLFSYLGPGLSVETPEAVLELVRTLKEEPLFVCNPRGLQKMQEGNRVVPHILLRAQTRQIGRLVEAKDTYYLVECALGPGFDRSKG